MKHGHQKPPWLGTPEPTFLPPVSPSPQGCPALGSVEPIWKAGRSAPPDLGTVVTYGSPPNPGTPDAAVTALALSPQPYDSLPTSQTCFFQLRLPPYSSQLVMAERLRYAINNCRSIDMDNYMLSRNVDNAEGSDTDY